MDNTIYSKTIKRILNMDAGIKVALFDERSKLILSNIIPHSTFLKHNFFMFELLKNAKERMGGVSCFVFVFSDSIPILLNQISNPCYESYHLFFMDCVEDGKLALIAENDIFCVVREVYECNMSCFYLDSGFYTVEMELNRETCADYTIGKINSFLKAMNISPTIQFSENQKKFAETIQSNHNKGRMLILDRSVDHITPLMYSWRYLPMIYEYFDYKNGIVKMKSKTFALCDDELFQKQKFTEIHKLGDYLKEENKNNIEVHLILHNFILKMCTENAPLSDIEYGLLNKSDVDLKALKDEKIEVWKRLKIFLVYLHQINFNFHMSKEEMLNDKILSNFPEFLDKIDLYADYVQRFTGRRHKHSFGDGDIKLAYKPPILKIVKKFMNKKLKMEIIGGSAVSGPNLVYIRGGLTLSEYVALRSTFSDVFILADYIIGYKDIMKMIKSDI